jgi:hypothetical protein
MLPARAAQSVVDPSRPIAVDLEPTDALQARGDVATIEFFLDRELSWNEAALPLITGFGVALASGADLNGDCVPELLMSAEGVRRSFLLDERPQSQGYGHAIVTRGLVLALDARSGQQLRTWQGAGPFDRFGTCLALLDDLDADGVQDFAVTSPGANDFCGRVEIFSSRDGRLLRRIDGAERGAQLGQSLAVIEDLDGDGLRDLALGAPHAQGAELESGCVLLCSSRNGAILAVLPGPERGARFGQTLDAAQDLDDDGRRDLLIGAPGYSPSAGAQSAGIVCAVSTLDGRWIGNIVGHSALQELGGGVIVYSGRTRRTLLEALGSEYSAP